MKKHNGGFDENVEKCWTFRIIYVISFGALFRLHDIDFMLFCCTWTEMKSPQRNRENVNDCLFAISMCLCVKRFLLDSQYLLYYLMPWRLGYLCKSIFIASRAVRRIIALCCPMQIKPQQTFKYSAPMQTQWKGISHLLTEKNDFPREEREHAARVSQKAGCPIFNGSSFSMPMTGYEKWSYSCPVQCIQAGVKVLLNFNYTHAHRIALLCDSDDKSIPFQCEWNEKMIENPMLIPH